MREVPKDEKWPVDGEVELNTAPAEEQLVQIALLMRLYDIGMAILTHLDEDTANELYEHHENKGHNNPDIFIPGPVE